MLLEQVEAEGFRNLSGRLECGPGLNIVCGENGQGKTNWLEAVYLLSAAKSFRTSRLSETINFEAPEAIVRGRVRQSDSVTRDLQVYLKGSTKTLTINRNKETAADFVSQLHTILFNSDQLEIVRSSPEARRRFLDDGIVSIYPAFAATLADYRKVIKQKNSLLQKLKDSDYSMDAVRDLLDPWNEQLISLGSRIHKARVRFVERLNNVLEKRLFRDEEVSIRYASSLEGKGDLSDYPALLSERLDLRVQAELFSGYSLIGVHRDDMAVSFNGRDLRKFGSSGQQRSALLILLIAKLSVFFEEHGEYPLFLLDDIDAELDYGRISTLLEYLDGKSQTFVTTSKESFVERFGSSSTIHTIADGTVAQV